MAALDPTQTETEPGGNLSFSGNPDFRGYVAANEPSLLGLIGNAPTSGSSFASGNGINPTALAAYAKANGVSASDVESAINGLYGDFNDLISGSGSGDGGDDSDSGSDSEDYAAPDAAIEGQASSALTQAQQALNSSNNEVGTQEQQQENELASTEAQQDQDYNDTLTTDDQDLTNAETAAKTQGNTDLTSLDRLIGSFGGGGSSVETEEVPTLVDKSVQSNVSGASTTKAKNDSAATTAWNTFLNNLQSQKEQLTDQANQQIATNQGDYSKNAQTLDDIIAAAKAGSIDPSDLSSELEDAEENIPAVINWTPTFSGTTPVYTAPPLSAYTLTPSQIAAASGTIASGVSGASVIPFLSSLTNQQQQPAAATA